MANEKFKCKDCSCVFEREVKAGRKPIRCLECATAAKRNDRAKYLANPENRKKVQARTRKWNKDNPEKMIEMRDRHWASHKEKHGVHPSTTANRKCPIRRLINTQRGRLRGALSYAGTTKKQRTLDLIGCTGNQLATYLESLFLPGMSLENYGDWHVDHIRPCNSFDLTDKKQQRQCFHFTNLQPLWAEDNLKKGASYAG